MKVICIFGTRPEAIKMAPIIKALDCRRNVENIICVTGQHFEMLNQVLDLFNIEPHHNCSIMTNGQTLSEITSRVLHSVENILLEEKPDRVIVHGDTTTAMASSLAAFYQGVPVAHVEAGLRSNDINLPFPEEINRRFVDQISDIMFVPTKRAKQVLEHEGLGNRAIHITGNTVIDALRITLEKIRSDRLLENQISEEFAFLNKNKKLILVTGHRRESFGDGMRRICLALQYLAQYPDIEILYPVHMNRHVREPVDRLLGGRKGIHLIEPVDYLRFCYLMSRCDIILTDSGGIQEEGPSVQKPVLVMRDVTERPEGIEAGVAKLVGTDTDNIVNTVVSLVYDEREYRMMTGQHNPYGDGYAANRICDALTSGT